MADVGLRVNLTGAEEARRGIEGISKAVNDVAFEDKRWADIQAKGQQMSQALRAEQDRRAKSLEELKKHTQGVVASVQEQMRQEEAAESIIGRVTGALKMKALQYLSVGAAVAGFVTVLKGSLVAAHEAEEATLRMNAVMAATGGSVGFTTGKLGEMAEAWQKSTRFDSEGIKSAMSVMLTFGNVQGKVFEDGMRLAMDYAELYRTDLSSAARIVGRALEDPINGLTALQRVIGTVSPATKDYIKELVSAGQEAQAQGVIIDLLKGKFGGFAETMNTGVVGAIAEVGKNWKDLLKIIGQTSVISETEGVVLGLTNKWLRGMQNIVQFLTDAEDRELAMLRFKLKNSQLDADAQDKVLDRIVEIEGRRTKVTESGAREREAAEAKAQDSLLARLQNKAGVEQDRIAAITKELKGLYAIMGNPENRGDVTTAAAERINALEKEQTRLIGERSKKAAEAAKQERDLVLGTLDYKIKIGEIEVGEKMKVIDQMLVGVRKGSTEELSLLNEKFRLNEQINKDYQEGAKNWVKATDEMVKADNELIYSWDKLGNRITITKKDYAEQIKNTQEINDRAAKAEIRQINETTYLFKEHKMAALKDLERQYIDMGDEGANGLKRIRGEMEALKGTTKATGVIVQDVGFDMGKVWQGVHTGLTQAIGDIARYALGIGDNVKSLGEALKGFFFGIANSIIDMFAKVVANEVFKWLFLNDGPLSGMPGAEKIAASLGGSVVSGAASGAAKSLLGDGSGGGDGGSFVGNLISKIGNLADIFGGSSGSVAMNVGNALGIGVGFNAAAIEGAVGIPELGLIAQGGGEAAWGVNAIGGEAAGAGAAGASGIVGMGIGLIGAGLVAGAVLSMLEPWNSRPRTAEEEAALAPFNPGGSRYMETWRMAAGVDQMPEELKKYLGKPDLSEARMTDTGYSSADIGLAMSYLALHNAGYVTPDGFRYAMGTDMIVSKPTFFSAGEVGTERVTVSPIGAAHGGARDFGGMVVHVNGLSLMDNFSARRLAYELRRIQRG